MQKAFLYVLFIGLGFCFAANAQSPGAVIDVKHYKFNIRLSDSSNLVKGKAEILVKFLKGANSFQLDLVQKNDAGNGMTVTSVTEKGSPLQFSQAKNAVIIIADASMGSQHTYDIVYQGIPADGLIISTNKFGNRTFFGDNWPNRAHNWLPCVDDPADKATVDFIVTAPDKYQVVANGSKTEETGLRNHLKLTRWEETAPISTKVMVIGVAGFAIDHTGDVNGIPVYSYVFPENKVNGFHDYAVAKQILGFYIHRIGPYAYEKLANVQSKTIFGGMENASAIFYFENSVGDKDTEALMAHEIAHQWFGDAASEKSFAHLWLSEGFATYMANIYLENKYGADTLKKRLVKDRIKVLSFENNRLTPVVDTAVTSNYMQLLNANSYEKGSWVLHMLRRKLGDDMFWKGIQAYYVKYDGGNANTEDFRHIMEQVSGQNLQQFFKQWLYSGGYPRLAITWSFNPIKKTVNIRVDQKQDSLYTFPLEVLINNKRSKISVSGRNTSVEMQVTEKQSHIVFDPDVNLLAGFEEQ